MKNKNVQKISIQTKLIAVFLLTSLVLLAVNLVLHQSMNRMTQRIDQVYAVNVSLNELQQVLDQVQDAMTEYLNTKSSDSMEDYYKYEQEYRRLSQELNQDISSQERKIMEKNIRALSEQYLSVTNYTVELKRGRNVEKYKVSYEEAANLYDVLGTFIYSLNNQQFMQNSDNYAVMLDALRYSQISNMVILGVVALMNLALIYLMTKEMIQPLRRLAEAAEKVGEGELTTDLVEVTTQDEIGVVTNAFNEMVLGIRRYIVQLKDSMEQESAMKEKALKTEAHLKDAQLKYLQAQISPHFLFNTLNAGAQLAMMEDADRTYTYIQNVADFFRYTMKDRDDTTLADELTQVQHYIYILNVRFSGEIQFESHVDEECLNVMMPSMVLQPIVENSVNYGIRNIDWQGRINLTVTREDGYICVSIRDNGIGMSQDKIDRIMEGRLERQDLSKNSNGVGLDNVIQRLRLFYDREDVLEITSVGPDMGTEVAVKLYSL